MSEAPFRTAAGGPSPTLERLAAQGESRRREMPREAEKTFADSRVRRLELAFGVAEHNAAMWGVFTSIAASLALSVSLTEASHGRQGNAPFTMLAWIVTCVLLGVTVWLASSREQERARKVEEGLRWAEQLPFPVEGFACWMMSEEPLMDVLLKTPLDARLDSALLAVNPAIRAEVIDERTTRVIIPPRKVEHGESTDWLGDETTFRAVVQQVLEPLHREVGVERVVLGGRMHPR